MQIRLAGAGDADILFALNEQFNGAGCTTRERLAASLRDNRQEDVFLAFEGEAAVGFCCVQLFRSMCYDRDYAEITELFVMEGFRRRGAASALLRFIEAYYQGCGLGGYQFFTGADNRDAQAFYERMGYRRSMEWMYRKRL